MHSSDYQTIEPNILLDGTKILYFPGIDFGKCIHQVLKESEKYYLIKRNGRMCYLGRGESVYSSPSYNILTKREATYSNDKFAVENYTGIEIEYKRDTKKQSYIDILKIWNELHKEQK